MYEAEKPLLVSQQQNHMSKYVQLYTQARIFSWPHSLTVLNEAARHLHLRLGNRIPDLNFMAMEILDCKVKF